MEVHIEKKKGTALTENDKKQINEFVQFIKDKDAVQEAEQEALEGEAMSEQNEKGKYEYMEQEMKQDEYEQACQEGYGDFN